MKKKKKKKKQTNSNVHKQYSIPELQWNQSLQIKLQCSAIPTKDE
jgi:hypothetical protein